MRLPRIHFYWPQRIAALLLLVFFGQCLWVIGHAPLTETEYRYAMCGREMWERPVPVAGYFTTCGNMQGDGTLAYRVAGLPLTVDILLLRAYDKVTHSEAGPVAGSLHDLRHQVVGIPYLLRVPFALFAVWIGGGVWWVSRRLFGNLGGFLALGLFCFSPQILSYAVTPNNEILTLWGLYGLIYTAIGIAHAMYGPSSKWKPRLYLFTFALGMTAAAHVLAALFGWLVSGVLMYYVAERRRTAVPGILVLTGFGAVLILLLDFALRVNSFLYILMGGAARFTLSLEPAKHFLLTPMAFPTLAAVALALLLFVFEKRSRYFGNVVPLVVALLLIPISTTQVATAPWLWALPFLLTFVAGVFADALETKYRKLYLALCGCILLGQVVLSFTSMLALRQNW